MSGLSLAVGPMLRFAPYRTPWIAALITLAFTGCARWLRGVSRSGAIAGAILCFVLFLSAGPGAFVALVSVFALAWITTRFGYKRKQELGTAEKNEGRNGAQVLANLSVAAASAAVYAITQKPAFVVASAAALSEAAADTVSSELGQARSEKARLITSWEEVPAGTDGAVTGAGTLGGVVSAILVSAICAATGFLPVKQLRVCVVAAVLGMMADSYLGALLERRDLLNNNLVNFLSTLIAAIVALVLA